MVESLVAVPSPTLSPPRVSSLVSVEFMELPQGMVTLLCVSPPWFPKEAKRIRIRGGGNVAHQGSLLGNS